MRTLGALAALVLLLMAHCLVLTYAGSNADRESLQKTGEAIRTAFAQGDVDRIMAYHHSEVIKALSFHKYLVGRDAVAEDLRKTLQQFKFEFEFEENRVESLLIQGDTAIEQTVFAIRSTPKSGGESSLFRGRTLQEESNRVGIHPRDNPASHRLSVAGTTSAWSAIRKLEGFSC